MKKNHDLKVGDVVYTYHNSSWGLHPMKVTGLTEDGVRCKHPEFKGEGWFFYEEIRWATAERKKDLAELVAAQKLVNRLEKSLFKDALQ